MMKTVVRKNATDGVGVNPHQSTAPLTNTQIEMPPQIAAGFESSDGG
jgi:hypothetical protein